MQKILFFNLVGGIAGDMLVGALLELGVPFSLLEQGIRQLRGLDVRISHKKAKRHQIYGTQFIVENNAPQGVQPDRSYRNIKELIGESLLSPNVKQKSLKIFEVLAIAEGKIHQVALEQVHFHEVGAWDSIVDIVCVALCLDYFQINDIYVSPIPTGTGFVATEHGKMPIPAPATLELLRGFEIIQDSLPFERTTPTGAAILAALAQPQPVSFQYTIEAVGNGTGTQNRTEVPNIIRCVLGFRSEVGNEVREDQTELIECSETNIDDSTPECLGYVHEQLLAIGALDVWFIPIQMKKNRPGLLLQVLHPPKMRAEIHQLIFRETTSLGIRFRIWNRVALERTVVKVETPWGIVRGKQSRLNGQIQFNPEFEDCRKIAMAEDMPLKEVYRVVEMNFWKH
ncbi:MAG: nickel pincer cofactor biosynthesis protein LarC [SAR324 cluster bacterium]|nr:nickel pincer cofactor biosynthesis protein LarC [SAR324 cluster bacterium]